MKTAAYMQPVAESAPVVRSEVMRKLFAMIARVALQDATVLILGETGSGKEVVVKEIHRLSPRCNRPLVEVNCAALPEHLMESELFGYEKGAFSGAEAAKPGLFELADGGTLLLDEIGEMDPKFQAKLLRVLDGHSYYRLGGSRRLTVNVRVIAATNRDLEEQIRDGRFRQDLYYRLAQFQLRVPPLRERPEDILALAEHFLRQHIPGAVIDAEARDILQAYSWPGNAREIKNIMLKTAMQAKPGTSEIRACDLPPSMYAHAGDGDSSGPHTNLAETEKRVILAALARTGGNQKEAAHQLGISARTIRRKLQKYQTNDLNSAGLGLLSAYQQRYFRVNIELPIRLRTDGQDFDAMSVNISAGGLAVRTEATLPAASLLEVTFNLPDLPSPIEAPVRLAWTGPGGLVGLQFADLHPAVDRELQLWLLARARAEGWADKPDASH